MVVFDQTIDINHEIINIINLYFKELKLVKQTTNKLVVLDASAYNYYGGRKDFIIFSIVNLKNKFYFKASNNDWNVYILLKFLNILNKNHKLFINAINQNSSFKFDVSNINTFYDFIKFKFLKNGTKQKIREYYLQELKIAPSYVLRFDHKFKNLI